MQSGLGSGLMIATIGCRALARMRGLPPRAYAAGLLKWPAGKSHARKGVAHVRRVGGIPRPGRARRAHPALIPAPPPMRCGRRRRQDAAPRARPAACGSRCRAPQAPQAPAGRPDRMCNGISLPPRLYYPRRQPRRVSPETTTAARPGRRPSPRLAPCRLRPQS